MLIYKMAGINDGQILFKIKIWYSNRISTRHDTHLALTLTSYPIFYFILTYLSFYFLFFSLP